MAIKKKPSGIDSSISYIVLRKSTKPDQHVVCKTRGPYTVSPVLVSYNEASLTKDELETLNPRETYRIAKVTLL